MSPPQTKRIFLGFPATTTGRPASDPSAGLDLRCAALRTLRLRPASALRVALDYRLRPLLGLTTLSRAVEAGSPRRPRGGGARHSLPFSPPQAGAEAATS